jgi:hypothetical protein
LIIERSKKTLKNEIENFGRVSKEVTEKLRLTTPFNDNQSKTLIRFDDDDTNENSRLLQQQLVFFEIETILDLLFTIFFFFSLENKMILV